MNLPNGYMYNSRTVLIRVFCGLALPKYCQISNTEIVRKKNDCGQKFLDVIRNVVKLGA